MSALPAEARKFLVTSQGVSATKWLAVALASHPDVFVAHGKHALDAVVSGDLARESRLSDRESIASGNVLAAWYAATSLEEVFAAYARVKPDARAIGSIHSYALHGLIERPDTAASLGGVHVVNVVRHPVTYIASHAALVRKAHVSPDLRRHYETDMLRAALAKVPELALVDCPDLQEFVAFAVSCFSAANLARDLAAPGIGHVRMEELTASLRSLRAWCEAVTGLEYANGPLERLMAGGPLNRHRTSTRPASPDEVFRAWAPWQRDVFTLMLPPSLLDQAESLGYDLSMTREHAAAATPRGGDTPCLADRLDDGELWIAWGDAVVPELIESHAAGFNLVRYRGRVWAVSQQLGPIDVSRVDRQQLQAYRDAGTILLATTVDEARRLADRLSPAAARQPQLIESGYRGFNIVRVGPAVVALAQRIGPVDLSTMTEAALASLVGAGHCVVAGSLVDARSGVDRLEGQA